MENFKKTDPKEVANTVNSLMEFFTLNKTNITTAFLALLSVIFAMAHRNGISKETLKKLFYGSLEEYRK